MNWASVDYINEDFQLILIITCLFHSSPNTDIESLFSRLSTEELMRMLELLDMLETKQPIKASDQELATLQYLLKNYTN
jgi:hypothetical protein